MPDCLHHAIDQLTTRGVVPEEIAEIVEVESEQVRSAGCSRGVEGSQEVAVFVGDAFSLEVGNGR